MERSIQASFYFGSNRVKNAFVSPALDAIDVHPLAAFARYYSLVNLVHWDSFGCAGGLAGYGGHVPLSAMGGHCRNKSFRKDETFTFGSTAGGDMLIYTLSGEGGFLSHENGQAYSLGSVEESLAYIFGELLERRTPEFDYAR